MAWTIACGHCLALRQNSAAKRDDLHVGMGLDAVALWPDAIPLHGGLVCNATLPELKIAVLGRAWGAQDDITWAQCCTIDHNHL